MQQHFSPQSTIYNTPMTPGAACDRCHAIRAKCIPSNFSTSCCRCFRLNHQCLYTRTRGLPGRRRKCAIAVSAGLSSYTRDQQGARPADTGCGHVGMPVLSASASSPRAQPHAWHLVSICTSMGEDHQLALHFTVVPGLAHILGRHVWSCLTDGPPILLETYLALRHTFHIVLGGQQALSHASLSTNSIALRSLRNACLQSSKDVIHFLWLTAFVQTFDRLARGTLSTNLIFESSLARLQNFQAQLTDNPDKTSPSLTCLIFADTVSSMLKSCKPTMKIPSAFEGIIDRYAGLCGSLLPLLYDVCCLLAAAKNSTSTFVETNVVEQWSDTYAAVIAWQPRYSPISFGQFSPVDQTVLLSQAHAYRATAIMLLDQIRPTVSRHPRYQTADRGHLDASPIDIILAQTRTCLQMTKEPPPFTNLPLIVAALESTDDSMRGELVNILARSRGLQQYGYTAQLRRALAYFWSEKDKGLGTNLLKFLEESIVPSILP
ncbi:hypothetical protein F5883DRAFT_533844 [Diaporthe sp. PMI_573]|nr:hypothetical protein F5883DRAFT_533844 [Diaporthaceae sp. PMI_573]